MFLTFSSLYLTLIKLLASLFNYDLLQGETKALMINYWFILDVFLFPNIVFSFFPYFYLGTVVPIFFSSIVCETCAFVIYTYSAGSFNAIYAYVVYINFWYTDCFCVIQSINTYFCHIHTLVACWCLIASKELQFGQHYSSHVPVQ